MVNTHQSTCAAMNCLDAVSNISVDRVMAFGCHNYDSFNLIVSRDIAYHINPLNQYTNILCASAPLRELNYDLDGHQKSAKHKPEAQCDRDFKAVRMHGVRSGIPRRNANCYLTNDGTLTYTWDGENRLIAACSGGALVISNAYDHQSRRVLKVTPSETRTFLYDGWNLIQETIATSTSTTTNHYIWGKDLSGTLQGAGGVGGLLAVCVDNSYYFPLYDNNGNITAYVDDTGIIVAEYHYDAFGNTISQSGTMAHAFPHRFSTKYCDHEAGLYYYGYRFYSPVLMRWMNMDPIEERGGINLYGCCRNNLFSHFDALGQWTIIRDPNQSWAKAKAEKGDTFQSLAEIIKLNLDEKTKWLKHENKSFVSIDDAAIEGCTYLIPNVMAVYTSKSGWGDGVITYVTHLKRKAISDGKRYEAKGYKIEKAKWASSETEFIDMWAIDGIYAISFAGHGSKYGFKPDKDSGSAVNPSEVSPKYKLQAVRAYSCLSDTSIPGNVILPDGTTPTYQWREHVAQDGFFSGFTGWANWVTQLWQRVIRGIDVVPD